MNGLDEWVALTARLFALLVFVGLLWPATLALLEPAPQRLHRIRLFVVASLVLLAIVQVVSIWVSANRIISDDTQAINVVAMVTALASAGVAAFGLYAFWPRSGDGLDQPRNPDQMQADRMEATGAQTLALGQDTNERIRAGDIGRDQRAIVNRGQADAIQETGEDSNRILRDAQEDREQS